MTEQRKWKGPEPIWIEDLQRRTHLMEAVDRYMRLKGKPVRILLDDEAGTEVWAISSGGLQQERSNNFNQTNLEMIYTRGELYPRDPDNPGTFLAPIDFSRIKDILPG